MLVRINGQLGGGRCTVVRDDVKVIAQGYHGGGTGSPTGAPDVLLVMGPDAVVLVRLADAHGTRYKLSLDYSSTLSARELTERSSA